MRRWGWICFVCLLFSFETRAINAIPSYTVFYLPAVDGAAPEPYIEVHWQVEAPSLQFRFTADSIYLGTIATYITISNASGIIKKDKYLLQTTPAADIRAAKLQNILDLHRYKVPPGQVKFQLELIDYNDTANKYTYEKEITVDSAQSKPFYSGIQLLDTAYQSQERNIFNKNNRIQLPLSANFLDDHRNTLLYYLELYQSQKVNPERLPLIQQAYITKKGGRNAIFNLKSKDTIIAGNTVPILGKFNISVLPSGNYDLHVVLFDANGMTITEQTLFFQSFNTNPTKATQGAPVDSNGFERVELLDLGNTFLSKYTFPQLKAILKMCLPISSTIERDNINNFLKNPDETYIRYFLFNFWKERDPVEPKKAWEKYTEKVKLVNRNFGSRATRGYETDRGRIFLTYGEPDQRVVVSSELSAHPYEVWQYDAPKGRGVPGAFLFYQPPYIVGDYILLHATVQGEVRNNNWRQMLYSNGSSTNNLNSRAEQFFPDNNTRRR